jgi:hypothetical protein
MDLGLGNVDEIIASSTTGYLIQFMPIFALIGGLILAFGVSMILLDFFKNLRERDHGAISDDDLMKLNDEKLDNYENYLQKKQKHYLTVQNIKKLQKKLEDEKVDY